MSGPTSLPTGAVTFLFTDIEGSTALWDTKPGWMEKAQATAHHIVTDTVTMYLGVVFKELGDGICAAFESAPTALHAAREAQAALTREDWGSEQPVRVRMAVHTGTAFPTNDDYVGPPLNRCARLLDAGHGGQILVSSTTAELIRSELQGESDLLPLGSFRLPGLSEPEEIYQLVGPGLPERFPVLRAPATRRTNLPLYSSSFVGRTQALQEASELLEKSRLLTLIGPGGAGKTRLAVQLAGRLVDQYRDGVWLVDLAPIRDPDLVIAAAAESLGVARRPTGSLTHAVLDHLRSQTVLVILDNCEHVIEAAAAFADTALRAAPGLTLLATSREGLGVDGEQRWPVPPLEIPAADATGDRLLGNEAIQLFADRGSQARPGFAVDAGNIDTVARICRNLDGIPLAIELGTARLKTLTLEDLADRIEDRFDLISGGTRTALPRHQTLQAVFDWSLDLLEPDERSLFRILSVFAGGFTLEAAEGVARPDLDVLDLLDRLVDKSLVIAQIDDSEARYRLLETLRRYGEMALAEQDKAEAVANRHAAYFSAFAEQARRGLRHDQSWYARLDSDHDNLRKALGWALQVPDGAPTAARIATGLREFWQVRGHWREGQRWIDLCLERSDRLDTALRGHLDHAAGVISAMRRDYARAIPHLESALEAFRTTGKSGDIADALFDLAQAAARHGKHARAKMLLSECRPLYEAEGNKTGVAEAGCVLAQVAVFCGEHDIAEAEGTDARDRFRRLGDQYGEAWVQSVLGELAYSRNELDEAERLFKEAATLAEEIEIPQFVANGLQGMGDVASARGSCRGAEQFLAASLRINRRIGDTLFVAGVIASLAETQARCENYHRAARLWGLEERLRHDLGSMPSRRRGGRYDRDYEELRRVTRQELGSDRFERSHTEGANLTLDQVLSELASVW
jgi:predicted ATPase/class 3 adenylate cyclase